MLIVGLTGGVGSGKSTVANLFAQHDIPIIDADVIARDLVTKNASAYHDIIDHFGKDVVNENGELNRRALRDIIFANKSERLWLEALLHPKIKLQIQDDLGQLVGEEHPYVIVVIPLLVESGPYTFLHRILVIDCEKQQQVQRLMTRDNISESDAKAMLRSQVTQQQRLDVADDVIKNDAGIDYLAEQVARLHRLYVSMV